MKRIIVNAMVFLLLGAIINVAVAWASAHWVSVLDHLQSQTPLDESGSTLTRWQAVSALRIQIERQSFITIGASDANASYWMPQSEIDAAVAELHKPVRVTLIPIEKLSPFSMDQMDGDVPFVLDARGWPAYSMQCKSMFDDKKNAWVCEGGKLLRPKWKFSSPPTSPLRPIWPGFAINTVFYAAVLWVLLALPGAVRRFVRRKRGRCTRCGYDLRGQVADDKRQIFCPECGTIAK
jgi:hypothetical protein